MSFKVLFLILPLACGTAISQKLPFLVKGQVRGVDGALIKASIIRVEGTKDVHVIHIETESDGTYSFETVNEGPVPVVARAEGYVSEEKTWTKGLGNRPLDFTLQEALSASGRVIDERGIGIPKAVVSLRYLGNSPRSVLLNHESGEIQTDDYGYFRFPAVAKGKPFVVDAVTDDRPFSSSEICSVVVTEQARLCTVRVTGPVRSLTGRVLDRYGNAAAGVLIRMRASADRDSLDSSQRASLAFVKFSGRSAKTDQNGQFSFGGVPAGNVLIIAGDGVSITHHKVLMAQGVDTASIELRLP